MVACTVPSCESGFPLGAQLTKQPPQALLRGIALSEHGSEGFRVRLRWLSEYASVADLVERPTWETQAEQYPDTVLNSEREKRPKDRGFGQDVPGTSGTQTSGYPGQKLYASGLFFCCFRHGVAGMSWDLGRDVPNLEKLYAGKLWADFSFPIINYFS